MLGIYCSTSAEEGVGFGNQCFAFVATEQGSATAANRLRMEWSEARRRLTRIELE